MARKQDHVVDWEPSAWPQVEEGPSAGVGVSSRVKPVLCSEYTAMLEDIVLAWFNGERMTNGQLNVAVSIFMKRNLEETRDAASSA